MAICASLFLSYVAHHTLADNVNIKALEKGDSRPPILTRQQEKAMKETGYNFLYDTPEVTL